MKQKQKGNTKRGEAKVRIYHAPGLRLASVFHLGWALE